jgi:hypothetical protein
VGFIGLEGREREPGKRIERFLEAGGFSGRTAGLQGGKRWGRIPSSAFTVTGWLLALFFYQP